MLATSFLVGVRSLGCLQTWELNAYDQMMELRPEEKADERILIITVGEADIQYQEKKGWNRKGSLSDQALTQLLQKLESLQPRVIGLDIYHDFNFEANLAEQLQRNQHFIVPCLIAQTKDNPTGISSPPGIPIKNLGFTDFPRDPDDVMRRQLLLMASEPYCDTNQSLNLRVALDYLSQEEIPPMQQTLEGHRKIGDVILRKFEHNAGGYQLQPADAMGYQILVNYRSSNPLQVTLTEILEGSIDDDKLRNLAKNPIILIGIDKPSDEHYTPYTKKPWPKKVSGVVVHAQMVSQIISAVLDGRPLLWWLPQWVEVLWMGIWSLLGGLLVLFLRSRTSLGIGVFLAISVLSGICFAFLLQGGWIPLIPCVIAILVTSTGAYFYTTWSATPKI
ncbi:MAG: CHASE2 domain-containing protein [Moorea sp. SIO2B7]|nr:CHASE2 domain-containing protein [Moorena sp. SIO2B7]